MPGPLRTLLTLFLDLRVWLVTAAVCQLEQSQVRCGIVFAEALPQPQTYPHLRPTPSTHGENLAFSVAL